MSILAAYSQRESASFIEIKSFPLRVPPTHYTTSKQVSGISALIRVRTLATKASPIGTSNCRLLK